jgi:gentisate 1,2-dioxygenase
MASAILALLAQNAVADDALLRRVAAALPDAIRIPRLYSGADGESHLDEVELPGVGPRSARALRTNLYATDIELSYALPGSFVDFHRVTTPRLLIILRGRTEIGLGDGSKHVLEAGDVVLATDTTGRGHTSRGIGTEPIVALTVRLPPEDPLRPKTAPCPPGVAPADCVEIQVQARERR